MTEWTEVVQHMIDWIEENIEDNAKLEKISDAVGYSPWYCSVLFHDVTGLTLKTYAARRRLTRVTEELRDTDVRILDLAVKYGYSSQEAFARKFKEQFRCTPAAYRRNPIPLPFTNCKKLFLNHMNEERIRTMEASRLAIRVEHIPAHKYLGIWEEKATNYGEFWEYHSCDDVCGYITSMDKIAHKIVTAHTAGWKMKDGNKVYFYGAGVDCDYVGPVPEGFELREIPESDYLVFSYPAFDFATENVDVMGAVEKMAWGFDPHSMGYEWNEDACQIYQRHYPEKLGYQVLRPVKKMA